MTGAERVAAVTGAASGIGRAAALALSRRGARVALCDRNAAGLAEVAKMIQGEDGQARVVELDVSDQGLAARAIDGTVQGWGRLDVLVNAAGIASSGPTSRGPVLGIAEEDWDRIVDVNLLGTVYCAQAAARHMMRERSGRARSASRSRNASTGTISPYTNGFADGTGSWYAELRTRYAHSRTAPYRAG